MSWLSKIIGGALVDIFMDKHKNTPEMKELEKTRLELDKGLKNIKKYKKWAMKKRPDGLTNYEYLVKKGVYKGTINWDLV